eukprot:2011738-Prymnesium_polylepis.2
MRAAPRRRCLARCLQSPLPQFRRARRAASRTARANRAPHHLGREEPTVGRMLSARSGRCGCGRQRRGPCTWRRMRKRRPAGTVPGCGRADRQAGSARSRRLGRSWAGACAVRSSSWRSPLARPSWSSTDCSRPP